MDVRLLTLLVWMLSHHCDKDPTVMETIGKLGMKACPVTSWVDLDEANKSEGYCNTSKVINVIGGEMINHEKRKKNKCDDDQNALLSQGPKQKRDLCTS